ncbi:MAG: DUF4199 domain-containing protein [Bacteroidota bacterium]|nr:DUF4199 domain-containing protein [Bacteroidota bacterium]
MGKIVLKYGLIAGAILVGMLCTMMWLFKDSSDFESGESFGYLFIIGAFSMIFLGIREYRDKFSGGKINFNTGFRIGLLITLISSACYVIGWMLYFHFIDDSFVEHYTAFYTEKLKASGGDPLKTEKEITDFHSQMTAYRKPHVMAIQTFLEVFPIGLIITVLCALLMRREKNSVDSEKNLTEEIS